MAEREALVAAVTGDIHFEEHRLQEKRGNQFQITTDRFHGLIENMSQNSDVIFLAGDITNSGTRNQAEEAAQVTRTSTVPVYMVVGNHDHLRGNIKDVISIFEQEGGVVVLQGQPYKISNKGNTRTVGITGVEGCREGIYGRQLTDGRFQERDLTNTTELSTQCSQLAAGLTALKNTDTIVLMHYSPTDETLLGERQETYPALFCPSLADVIDREKQHVLAVFHGHAHRGISEGKTPGGVTVYNVAMQVLAKKAKMDGGEIQITDLYRIAEL